MKEIPLTQGQVALVDDEDYDYLMQWKWCAMYDPTICNYYAVRNTARSEWVNGKSRLIYMHKVILGNPDTQVDHRNVNTLDNRNENLRIATASNNQQNKRKYKNNTSGYKGVVYAKRRGKWQAVIKINGKAKFLGYFATPESAFAAYTKAALELHCEFARLE